MANPEAPIINSLKAVDLLKEQNPITRGTQPLRVVFISDITANGKIIKYEWDFEGDGIYDICESAASSVVKTYTWQAHIGLN